jgi:hypothetical protein
LVLSLSLAPGAWAEQRVITIYFGGTGLPENAWKGSESRWDTPNLIAALAHYHDETGADQHKEFIAGVGAAPDCDTGVKRINQQKNPHNLRKPKEDCRLWNKTITEAIRYLQGYIGYQALPGNPVPSGFEPYPALAWDDRVILNVVGHSRGAVAAFVFLHRLIEEHVDDDQWIKSINLIALDPVPGIVLAKSMLNSRENDYQDVDHFGWDAFELNDRVTNFLAIYVEDERSREFAALVPDFNALTTRALMVRYRGAHQTIAGNIWMGGHAPQLEPPPVVKETAWNDPNEALYSVKNLTAIAIIELLTSQQWGSNKFDEDFLDRIYAPYGRSSQDERRDAFLANLDIMNHPYLEMAYRRMRITSYFPVNVVRIPWDWPLEVFVDEKNNQLVNDCVGLIGDTLDLLFETEDRPGLPRCIVRVYGGSHFQAGLEQQMDIRLPTNQPGDDPGALTGQDMWDVIYEMGSADDDGDGTLNDDDLCPGTAPDDPVDANGCSDAQVDSDSDGFCDVDPPSFGPSSCTGIDNCPDIANDDQADLDVDGIGDVCDSDRDGDSVDNSVDNCPNMANKDQADLDVDGIGDVCDPDIDGDGVDNDIDNCPYMANSDQADLDNDGIGDVCDPYFDADSAFKAFIVRLQAIVSANPGACRDKVEDALYSTKIVLRKVSRTPPRNVGALGTLEGAVGDLEAAYDDGACSDPGELSELLDDLVNSARAMAMQIIAEAISNGGSNGDIRDAQKAFSEGEAFRAAGKHKDAVAKYKDAVSKVS